jgi:hypothetical protein
LLWWRGAVERIDFQALGALDPFPGVTHGACIQQMMLITLDGHIWPVLEPASSLHTQRGGTAAQAAAVPSAPENGSAADDGSLFAFLLNTNCKGRAASFQPLSTVANRDSAATANDPQVSAMRFVDAVYG